MPPSDEEDSPLTGKSPVPKLKLPTISSQHEPSQERVNSSNDNRNSRITLSKGLKDEIKKRMERRYVKYFKHWKDYEMLTCILAMIGLVLALVEVSVLSLFIWI